MALDEGQEELLNAYLVDDSSIQAAIGIWSRSIVEEQMRLSRSQLLF